MMFLLIYVHHAKIRVYHVSEQVYTMSPVYTLIEEGKARPVRRLIGRKRQGWWQTISAVCRSLYFFLWHQRKKRVDKSTQIETLPNLTFVRKLRFFRRTTL